ncbi:AAA family ATPase [Myxococcus sp. RHSTA-1-4]|uniref:AAA family ATPase n=1 Tax=Myxococcus sp. RHSTA-1-4 TaxID=2874601 RepID=UPI001CC12E23|nr:ATP-binding protein [Myxococcus sp. RHSTA-1-4]MBZ4419718.1 ATP-binding protein [Myxococcus sp. RHSTA-1-4]
MIHKLTLRNFKGIESAELALERLTVFVGPNASGKTSILQALALLSQMANPDLPRAGVLGSFGGLSAVLKRGTEGSEAFILAEGSWRGDPGYLQVDFNPEDKRPVGIEVTGEWKYEPFEVVDPPPVPFSLGTRYAKADRSALPDVLRDWENNILLRLEPRKLAEPSYAESVEPRVHSDGSGVASVLAQMALNRPDNFAELLSALRAIIPQMVRVRLSLAEVTRQEIETIRIDEQPITRTVNRTYSGHRVLFDLLGASDVPSEGASEGTLLVLGLLAVLFSTPRPKLVLLDDLDRGLHPKAQKDLVAQLRKLLERDPELQIIATSHSPYLVDHLDPKEVRLSTVLPDGTIRFAELMQHPDFERWKEVMRPGEFWSTVGEGWVGSAQEKPQQEKPQE